MILHFGTYKTLPQFQNSFFFLFDFWSEIIFKIIEHKIRTISQIGWVPNSTGRFVFALLSILILNTSEVKPLTHKTQQFAAQSRQPHELLCLGCTKKLPRQALIIFDICFAQSNAFQYFFGLLEYKSFLVSFMAVSILHTSIKTY